MAIIHDFNEKLKVKVTPRYTNWWSFDFEFTHEDKPIFNKEILKNGIIKGDEYNSFLEPLEEAVNSKENKKKFSWDAWEDEVFIEMTSFVDGDDESENQFEITFNMGNAQFVNDEISYGFHALSVRIFVSQKDFRTFFKELNVEMLKVIGLLDPPREISGSQPK